MSAVLFEDDPELDGLQIERLRELLREEGPPSMKGRALAALGRRAGKDESVVPLVESLINDPASRRSKVIGTVTVAQMGIGGLLASGAKKAKAVAEALIESWEEPEKEDLIWLLRSAGLR